MLFGTDKSTSITNKLIIGFFCGVLYRTLSLFLEMFVMIFRTPHKMYYTTNIFIFYSFILMWVAFFLTPFLKMKTGVIMSTFLVCYLWYEFWNIGLPLRSVLFLFSALSTYVFLFASSYTSGNYHVNKFISGFLGGIPVIVVTYYPFYLYMETYHFRILSISIASFVSFVILLVWISKKYQ